MSHEIVNIAGYKFVPLGELADRKASLLSRCRMLELKGTILISSEGINLFVAGTRENIDSFLAELTSENEFANIPIKESYSDYQPFSRMLVRIKKEIISMGVPQIQPAKKTSPKVSAGTLKKWLDDGRDITLLDVRNDYEVEIGTFESALPIGIESFREFPKAIQSLSTDLRQKPVVMFCTGGIRCEKAGPIMEHEGFGEIYQLDGGILKYFEECGGEHYEGECFVFDKRVALDSTLTETETEQCYACQAILSIEDQKNERYVPGKTCPHCYKTDEQIMQQLTDSRNARIAEITTPLPGNQPYENVRPMNVPLKYDQQTVIDFLSGLHPHLGAEFWISACEQQRIRYKDKPIHADQVIRSGWRIEHLIPQTVEPAVNADIKIIYEDDALIVVDKPAPLPMHPCGRFNRNSLIYILGCIYSGERLRMSHRLDANTTGAVIICRKRIAADWIRNQFEHGKIQKTYLARIHGAPSAAQFECDVSIADTPSVAGVRLIDENGLEARTEFRVVKQFKDGTSLVECYPKTGRTNQIRVHLWHLGFPILGDPSYRQGGELKASQTLSVDAEPMCLHAWQLQFPHPFSRKELSIEAPRPAWATNH